MMKPYPKWMNALVIVFVVMLLIVSVFLGRIFFQYKTQTEMALLTLVVIILGALVGVFEGKIYAMQKYGGIAIELEDIIDGRYRIEDILIGHDLAFRTVILNPVGTSYSYHIADGLAQFPNESIGVTVDIKNGKIFSYVY